MSFKLVDISQQAHTADMVVAAISGSGGQGLAFAPNPNLESHEG